MWNILYMTWTSYFFYLIQVCLNSCSHHTPEHDEFQMLKMLNVFICIGLHTPHHTTASAAQVVIGQANPSAVIPTAQAGTLLLNPVIWQYLQYSLFIRFSL
jgi:hypothetical protein